jgi:hypothetical protein
VPLSCPQVEKVTSSVEEVKTSLTSKVDDLKKAASE